MDVLLIGAGVIGTVYGTQLAQTGHPVDVLDHGQRTRQIQRTGLAITNLATGRHQMQRCSVVSDVSARNYDLVLVSVRADHLASTAAHLRALPGTPTVMFLGNNPAGRQQLPAPIPGSTLLGFPGIGGTLRDDSVGYLRLRRQPTTLETGGGNVVVQFAATLNRAGFPVVQP